MKKTIGGTTTDYFYAGSELIAEKTGAAWKDYIFFGGQRMAEQTGTTPSTAVYLHTDHLGSTRRCTDANGASAGTWGYTYNAFNQVLTRTDARGVITNYTYDALNRLKEVSYNVGSTGVPATNTVTYTYGESAASNNNGRLTNVTNTTVSDTFAYDALGRITQDDRVINSTTYTTQYQFNLASEMTQITYPSGRVVKQDFDAIGRLSKLYKDLFNVYADTFGYSAAGQVTGFNYGNGVAASFGYSAERLQLTSLTYTKSAQDLLKLNYYYKTDSTNCPSAPSGNSGQIQCILDNSNTTLTPGAGGRSVTHTYDTLARLSTATTTGSTQFPAWGLSWTYDRYGNRTQQSISSGCTGLTCPTNSLSISASTNRITDAWASYDANGNMLNDGLNALTYDAENQMITSGAAMYTNDGAGLRVKKVAGGTTTVYIFSGAKVIAEYENGAAVGSPTREYIYLGSQLLAKFEGGATQYHHPDHLSNRVISDSSGSISAQSDHFPFGENWFETGGTNKLKFTSYERDAESGNDFAMFRSYVNRFGRFSSPDPIAGSIADPQSLNRYGYVQSDPTNLVDPLGLKPPQECNAYLGCWYSMLVFEWRPGTLRCGLDPFCDPRPFGSPVADESNYEEEAQDIWGQPRQRRPTTLYKAPNNMEYGWACVSGSGLPRSCEWTLLGARDDPQTERIRRFAEMVVLGSGPVADPKYIAGWYLVAATMGGAAVAPELAAAAGLRFEGPQLGYTYYGHGRIFGVRWGPLTLFRLDYDVMDQGLSPALHVHLFSVGTRHGIRIRVWPNP